MLGRPIDFVEFRRFTMDWLELRLDDDALLTLQILIASNPQKPPTIKGTGGLRKLRFAPPSWRTGKRGAVRICYVFFAEFSICYLLRAYGKNEKDDLSDEQKKSIRKVIKRIEVELSEQRER